LGVGELVVGLSLPFTVLILTNRPILSHGSIADERTVHFSVGFSRICYFLSVILELGLEVYSVIGLVELLRGVDFIRLLLMLLLVLLLVLLEVWLEVLRIILVWIIIVLSLVHPGLVSWRQVFNCLGVRYLALSFILFSLTR
jgi:hypothetical protein